MGKQSSRIRLNGKDHKEIRLNGNYHKSANREGNVLWEKIVSEEEYSGLELTFYVKYGDSVAYLYAAGDFTIDWGDGTVESYSKPTLTYIYHDYGIVSGFKYVDAIVQGNVTDLDFKANSYLSSVNSALPPTLEKTDFSTMFAYLNDRDLTINSDLFKYCTNVTDFSNCFYNSWLVTIPSGLFDNCVSARSLYGCFQSSHVTAVPDRLFANLSALEDLGYCFNGCSLLETVGFDILDGCNSVTNIKNIFGFTPIKRLEDGLFDDLENLEVAERMCWACTDLEYIPYTLFDNCEKLNNVIGAFYNGNAITSSLPPLWERDISVWGGTYANVRGCYYLCSNAENYADAYSVGLFTSSIS